MSAITSPPASAPTEQKVESFWNSRVGRRFRRNKLAMLGLIVVIGFIFMAIFAPLIATPKGNCLRDLDVAPNENVYNPFGGMFWKAMVATPVSCYQIFRLDYSPTPKPPGSVINVDGKDYTAFWGTTNGYDIWYGIVWGTRIALFLSIVVEAITVFIGVVVGSVVGYFGGWLDNLVMRFIDVIFAFPGIILTVVLVTLLKPSLTTMIIAFSVTGWAGYARVLRGEILKTRALEFVDGARALGVGNLAIIFKHILPNTLSTLTVLVVLDLGTVPLGAAGLSFLGLGLPVGFSDWGQLINFARAYIQGPVGSPFAYWYVTFFPAVTIILFSLSWNLLGAALRDAIDPRER
jgi:peptide/nickel transport system permease protein